MNTRDRILDAAYEAFAEKGYNGTSLNEIASKIGVTRPALYYHFPSKEELFVATYERINPLANVDTKAILDCETPDEFERAFEALLRSVVSNMHGDTRRARFIAAVESTSFQVPAVFDKAVSQDAALQDAFASAVEQGMKIGALPHTLDAEAAVQYICIVIYGISETLLLKKRFDWSATWPLISGALFAARP